MTNPQPGILRPIPAHSCYAEFNVRSEIDARDAIALLQQLQIDDSVVVGFGARLCEAAGWQIEGHRPFDDFDNSSFSVPATQADLWIWTRADNGESATRAADRLATLLSNGFEIVGEVVPAFKYDIGRDLTGYEDGTENPVGDDAVAAAISRRSGTEGSSFVAVQKWRHDMDQFHRLSPEEQDDIFGRHRESNEEYDAPPSAHAKRTAQESFDPEAFLLRRSSPWKEGNECGLMFVAFGATYDPFKVQMRRMVGLDDEILDGLFQYSRPLTGSYYWCPSVSSNGRLLLPEVIGAG